MKQNQLDEIASLENQIKDLRSEQTRVISELRSEFLREKADHKRDADSRITAIVKAANREAKQCLSESTLKIKMENQKLRNELYELIEQTKVLNEHKQKLEKQREELTYEIKYAEDLKKVRSTQQKRVIERLFPNDQEEFSES